MNKIDSIIELTNPKFVVPVKINYTQNGKQKEWEAVKTKDCVSILLYHRERQAFVLVKQLRIPVLHANEKNGMMYELCAGLIDKDATDIQIAKEEILEECGYDIPVQNLQRITSFYTSVGISGTKQTLFYAECNENMKVDEGGGLEDEEIEVIYLRVNEAKKFMFDESYQKTPGMLMAFYWFFDNKSMA